MQQSNLTLINIILCVYDETTWCVGSKNFYECKNAHWCIHEIMRVEKIACLGKQSRVEKRAEAGALDPLCACTSKRHQRGPRPIFPTLGLIRLELEFLQNKCQEIHAFHHIYFEKH